MEQNILRALHKNFLPKEMQEALDSYEYLCACRLKPAKIINLNSIKSELL